MAEGTKTSALTALTGANLASTDLIAVVDVSDTTMAASGTNKKMTAAELAIGVAAVGTLATDAEVTSAISTHAAQADPHTVYALESSLATIATTGSASNLTTGTVPTARLGSGSANSNTYLRGDQAWSSFPSLLDSGLGGSLPWERSPVIGPEMWLTSNFAGITGSTNTTVLAPTLAANGTNQTLGTTVGPGAFGNMVNGDTAFRFTCTVTSMPSDGWASVGIRLVDGSGNDLAGTREQTFATNSSVSPLGRYELEFYTPVGVDTPRFQLKLTTVSNSTTGSITVTDCSLVQIVYASRPMLYGADNQPKPSVFVPLFDPVSGTWKMYQTEFGEEGLLDNSWNVMTGFSTDRPFSFNLPDPTFAATTVTVTQSPGSSSIALTGSNFQRSLRWVNNDQVIEVYDNDGAYELHGNVHGDEQNVTPAVWEVDVGDGTWATWSTPTVKQLRPCHRLRFTYPTEFTITDDVTPFASIEHVLTVFNDGVQRMDREMTFLKDVRVKNHFEWMSTFDSGYPKLGRIGRGFFVIDEVDIHVKLAAPASPSATPAGSGGTLPAGTYGYVVTALTAMGETTPTALVTATTTGSTSLVTVAWTTVSNAIGYRIYGRSSVVALARGERALLATVGPAATSWDDDYSAVPTPGMFPPDVNTARRDTGASNGLDYAAHDGANWAAWYDVKLNMVYANLYDRDAVTARAETVAAKTRLEMAPGICKNYLNVYFTGDGDVVGGLKTHLVTTGTVWSATHWAMVYCPADRENWHMEAAIRSMDLTKLKELYPAT